MVNLYHNWDCDIRYHQKQVIKKVLNKLEEWGEKNKGYHIALSIPVKEFKKKIKELREEKRWIS